MLPRNTGHFVWNCIGNRKTQRIVLQCILDNNRAIEIAEFVICNSFKEIEEPVFTSAPGILPVGPLLTGLRPGRPAGHFWPEDTTCISWLKDQPPQPAKAFPGLIVYL
ncbi:hypothetical protein B296_00006131 [Ensete ventricosum]|uniref:Uncharacterized protein n=1 Tax=Ensete ventricosum TaxID=4639 RepID=A0A427ABS4_ENSVE|nr:hypothetical protein B296_00006131 [Ensete ventricosum]